MIKNDKWIAQMAIDNGMIYPFEKNLIRRTANDRRVISYGASSFGYDIRLSPKEFLVFSRSPGLIVDPKNFCDDNLESVDLKTDWQGEYFILPAHSYGLGVALEKLTMPPNVTALCIGKSTYARCGLILNATPVEAGWYGHLTLEISNSSDADCKVYANEGIAQLIFLEGENCNVSYEDRDGKYQGQLEQVIVSRV